MLDVLRDELGLTGSKEGCGSGDCGACSDHRRRRDRLLLPDARRRGRGPARSRRSRASREGDKLHPVQQKFLEHAALQCGFCTPGFIVAAKALLDENPNPTEERGPLLAGRQPVPLHRLRQDRPRRDGCRRGYARRGMTDEIYRRHGETSKSSAPGRSVPTASTRSPAAPIRRRHGDARHAVGQDQAQPARARPHRVDRHRRRRGRCRA